MPRIINAYDGNSALGDSLSKLGEAIYGDQSKNEVYRQKAFSQKRENDTIPLLADAVARGDRNEIARQGVMANKTGQDTGDFNRLSVSNHASGLDDPRMALATMGAGGSFSSTAPGQGRSLANDRSIASGHDATTLKANDMTTARQAATQQSISEREQNRLTWEFEHKPVILYNRQDGRSIQVAGDQARAMQAQGWEPIAAEPPKTQTFDTASGDKAVGQWNRGLNRWERFDPDTLPPVTPTPSAASAIPPQPGPAQPFNGYGRNSGAMPVSDGIPAAQNTPAPPDHGVWGVRPDNPASLRAPTAVPPGVNGPAYRTETAKKTADSNAMLQEQAAGALDFLKASGRAKEIYKRSPDVFGPWVGQPGVNDYVRAPLAAAGSPTAAANMGKYNDVEAITKELASAGLKGLYGARPTNIDLIQNNAMFGGLRSADSATAIRLVEEQEMKHLATISRALKEGLIRPENIDPQVAALGIKAGVLDPRWFPAATAPGAQPAAPAAPATPQRWERGPNGQLQRVQ